MGTEEDKKGQVCVYLSYSKPVAVSVCVCVENEYGPFWMSVCVCVHGPDP